MVSHSESRKHQDATSKAKTLSKDKKNIYVCGKGQSEHGHTWNKETKSEDGNFTRFLRWKAEGLLLTHILTWRATFALRTIEGSK